MKHYTITVNGNTYEVSVEENSVASSAAPHRCSRQHLHLLRQHRYRRLLRHLLLHQRHLPARKAVLN